ncbi:endomucin [Microtus ochrogaster]|uniref:Endomucin n=1 Tax=Microtus ochrogaster TaxID=79684 RepID=A0ABM0L218_MICOH|nr:endomucin [Microtus ochrogaster]
MQLLQVTALLLLLCNRVCCSEASEDVQNKSASSPPETSTTKLSVATPGNVSVTNPVNSTKNGTAPTGKTDAELTKHPLTPAPNSLTTVKHEEKTTPGVIKNQDLTTNTTVPNLLSNVTSTLPSTQHKTENQSSIKTPEVPGTTQLPDASPKTTASPSASLTTPKSTSRVQDTADGEVTATPLTISRYSDVILPVVIALIVITLLVFTLVGLYRMCWKREPGAPENGNDQPQSDKESVKLLTVKTISHESGERSAQGKTKN